MSERTWLPSSVLYTSRAGTARLHFSEVIDTSEVELRRIDFDRPATTDWLRQIPVGRIVAWANGRPEILAALRGGGEIALNEEDRWLAGRRPNLHLNVPPARKRPDAFYARVVELHTWLAAEGSRGPAKEIAEANEVPVSTVHRWMKEARARGLTAGEGGGSVKGNKTSREEG